jgi:hypothetical protein
MYQYGCYYCLLDNPEYGLDFLVREGGLCLTSSEFIRQRLLTLH